MLGPVRVLKGNGFINEGSKEKEKKDYGFQHLFDNGK